MVTVHDDRKVRYAALDAGITDFLTKPVDARECLARCRNLLTLRRQQLALEDRRRLLEHMVEDATREVKEREKETLLRLARAGEFRDEETGYHLIRMSRYSRLIAKTLGLERDEAETIELAAPLHDIGKIGIPDQILLKPSRLEDGEWQVMRRHPVIGHEILKGSASKYVRMGALVALGHHEKYDGSGYPNGLVGDHVPLCARIVAVADVYDALTSVRPYKKAWPSEQAFEYVRTQSGRHFDPRMVEAFLGMQKEVLEIQNEWSDPPEASAADRPSAAAPTGFIAQLRARLAARPDTEHEQGILRLVISSLVFLYLLPDALLQRDTLPLYVMGISPGARAHHLLPHRLFHRRSRRRGACSRSSPTSPRSAGTWRCSASPPGWLLLLYIWVTLGSGFRFGARYLLSELGMSVVGFGVVLYVNDFWRAHTRARRRPADRHDRASACTCCRWCAACSTRSRAPRRPTWRSGASSPW